MPKSNSLEDLATLIKQKGDQELPENPEKWELKSGESIEVSNNLNFIFKNYNETNNIVTLINGETKEEFELTKEQLVELIQHIRKLQNTEFKSRDEIKKAIKDLGAKTETAEDAFEKMLILAEAEILSDELSDFKKDINPTEGESTFNFTDYDKQAAAKKQTPKKKMTNLENTEANSTPYENVDQIDARISLLTADLGRTKKPEKIEITRSKIAELEELKRSMKFKGGGEKPENKITKKADSIEVKNKETTSFKLGEWFKDTQSGFIFEATDIDEKAGEVELENQNGVVGVLMIKRLEELLRKKEYERIEPQVRKKIVAQLEPTTEDTRTPEQIETARLEQRNKAIDLKLEEIRRKMKGLDEEIKKIEETPDDELENESTNELTQEEQLFETLKNGKTEVNGKENEMLAIALPYFTSGKIKTVEDMKEIYAISKGRAIANKGIKKDDSGRGHYTTFQDLTKGKEITLKGLTKQAVEKEVKIYFDSRLGTFLAKYN